MELFIIAEWPVFIVFERLYHNNLVSKLCVLDIPDLKIF